MAKLSTAPRLGSRLPPLPPLRDPGPDDGRDGGLRPGDLLDGRYQIEDRVGEGGVGVVYRALQVKLHRRVAVKLLQPASDEALRPRFEREAITLAALCHPNIVSVQDYGHTRGNAFLVMELLQGRTLRELIDAEGALAVPRALSLTREVLRALAYAHELGIVHRDLKPANLLVQALPHHEHVKVLDFGFVKLLPGSHLDRGEQLSRAGFTFGTPAYMSPEHATGGSVDGRSDLYSLGILLFEMLTGKKPFEGELPEVIRAHLSAPRPRLSASRPELAGRDDLQALVERAMAKDREARFQDAGAFLSAIEAVLLAPSTSGTIVKRQSDPMLAGARANLSQRTTQLRAQLRRTALASRSGTKSTLARAQTGLTGLIGRLLLRVQSEPQRPSPSETPKPKRAAALEPLFGVALGPVRISTIVLDDPTHLDLIEAKPPSPKASDRARKSRRR